MGKFEISPVSMFPDQSPIFYHGRRGPTAALLALPIREDYRPGSKATDSRFRCSTTMNIRGLAQLDLLGAAPKWAVRAAPEAGNLVGLDESTLLLRSGADLLHDRQTGGQPRHQCPSGQCVGARQDRAHTKIQAADQSARFNTFVSGY